jgi:hypothetical protein
VSLSVVKVPRVVQLSWILDYGMSLLESALWYEFIVTYTPVTGIDGRIPVVMGLAAWKSYRENLPVKLSKEPRSKLRGFRDPATALAAEHHAVHLDSECSA